MNYWKLSVLSGLVQSGKPGKNRGFGGEFQENLRISDNFLYGLRKYMFSWLNQGVFVCSPEC